MMEVPEDWMRKLLEYARPKGRARVRRKGRGCVERRKRARAEVTASRAVELSPAAKEFVPSHVAPPLPREPEPGSMMYRAVAKKVMEDILSTEDEGDGEDGSGSDEEEFYDARAGREAGEEEEGEDGEEGTNAEAEAEVEAGAGAEAEVEVEPGAHGDTETNAE